MNQKLKAYLLMAPMLIIVAISIVSTLWALIVMSSAIGWTMKDTKQGLVIGGFLTAMVIIFRMFEKGCTG